MIVTNLKRSPVAWTVYVPLPLLMLIRNRVGFLDLPPFTGPVCGWHSSAYGRTYPITTVETCYVGPLPRQSKPTLRPLEADLPEAVANARVAPMREWIGDTQAG